MNRLIDQLASQEQELLSGQFLAPRVGGGAVRTRLSGFVYTFQARPADFEGWGVFQPLSESEAELVDEADLPQVLDYLHLFPSFRVHLIQSLRGATWLAYPVNESDARQRLGHARPLAVHLVTEGIQFEQALCRWDGSSLWFEEIDRRADPAVPERLREGLARLALPEEVSFSGLTPEMLTVYRFVLFQDEERRRLLRLQREEREQIQRMEVRQRRARLRELRQEDHLRDALEMGGGRLESCVDRGDYWTTHWVTRDGERHSSAIRKGDLTVLSAGICLSGEDQKFDLHSLVGVVEQANFEDW